MTGNRCLRKKRLRHPWNNVEYRRSSGCSWRSSSTVVSSKMSRCRAKSGECQRRGNSRKPVCSNLHRLRGMRMSRKICDFHSMSVTLSLDWLIVAPYAIGRLIDWLIDWLGNHVLPRLIKSFIPNRNMSSFDSGLPAELPVGKMKRPYRKKQNNLAVFLATHQNDFIFPASGCPLGSWVFFVTFFL